jgi:hypothetical protein
MGRTHIDPLPRSRIDPSAEHAATGKHKRMGAVAGDDGKLKVAIERRGRYRLPHSTFFAPTVCVGLDLDQQCRLASQPAALSLPLLTLIQVKAWPISPATNARCRNDFGRALSVEPWET